LFPAKDQIFTVAQIPIAAFMFLYLQIPIISQSYTVFFLKVTLGILEAFLNEKMSIIASLKFQALQLWLGT
jgi:hypothetical protein